MRASEFWLITGGRMEPEPPSCLLEEASKAVTRLQEAERLRQAGDLVGSLGVLEALFSSGPLAPGALNDAGLILQKLGKYERAEAAFLQAIQGTPEPVAALVNLGALRRMLGRPQEAFADLMKALEIDPDSAVGWNNLGMLLRDLRRQPMAISAFKRAVSLAPEWVVPRRNLGVALSEAGDTSQALQEFRAAIELAPGEPQTFSNFLLCLNYLENLGCSEIIKAHRAYGERFAVEESSPFANPRQRNRTLRVGFVSGDLRDHSVSWFFEPLLESLAGSDLECVCISSAPVSGPVTDRLKLQAAGWLDIFAHSDESAERMIRDAGIDVLIDLSGHTAANRLALFARRPAPVQMTMIGYLQTTGLRTMDYRISDAWLDPDHVPDRVTDQREVAEENDAPEQLIRLKSGAFGFRLPADAPEVGPLPASSASSSELVFASLNNLTKLQPKVIEAWARILSSVEGSRLLVLGSDSERLLRGLAQYGVGPERVVHHQRMPMSEFYKMLSGVHIALDTFPFNGLTVNLLAAWMGVPTLTLRGNTPHGRAGSAVAERLGYPELIAESVEDYVAKAVRLARDPEALGGMRVGLRERIRLGFGDHAAHAAQFREAVRVAWEGWCGA